MQSRLFNIISIFILLFIWTYYAVTGIHFCFKQPTVNMFDVGFWTRRFRIADKEIKTMRISNDTQKGNII